MSFEQQAQALELGESPGTFLLESLEEFHAALDSMAPQAKRHIKIFTQELEHAFYDRSEFLDLLTPLFRDHRGFSVSILLKDPNKAAKLGHRLVELQKRLPTRCEIRSLPREYEDMTDEYMIVDDLGMVKRFALGSLRGHCEFRAVPDAVKYAREFNEIWARGMPCTELRRLAL
ncbi:hypothetical protein [Ketobacter sp.]|uniref:DUF7931 domain-containing protein n=1 Tax=Ketobacter sp. TaxID=2083498 RepID=UPI000F0FD502|nr:hypothetical protein [Ketobacter sp.]RLT97347.1 MAG: hypothetical protein D9N14_11180 [Ketobacter sp.]